MAEGAVADAFYAGDNPEYKRMLEESAASGKCLFCGPKFAEENPIVAEEGGWFAIRRKWPVQDRGGQDVKNYFVLIKRSHEDGLTDQDRIDSGRLFDKVCKQFGVIGGAECRRFGDYRFSGRTIFHEHSHLIQPRLGHIPDLTKPHDIRAMPFDFPAG